MNLHNFPCTAYKIIHDEYDPRKDRRIIDLVVQSDEKTLLVTVSKQREEEFFVVQTIKSSAKEQTVWHMYQEQLDGVPVLVQLQNKFYVAVISESQFPVVVRVITFSSMLSRDSFRSINLSHQVKLKQKISTKLLIGWHLNDAEQSLLVEKKLGSESTGENKPIVYTVVDKETKLQKKRNRQVAIQNRSPIEIVVPGQGKKRGVPVLDHEWPSLRHETPVVLMNGKRNPVHELGMPVAFFKVDKSKPTKPSQMRYVNLMQAIRASNS
jgi:hypothetical protein